MTFPSSSIRSRYGVSPKFDFSEVSEKSWPSSSKLVKFLFFMDQTRVFTLSKLAKFKKSWSSSIAAATRNRSPVSSAFFRSGGLSPPPVRGNGYRSTQSSIPRHWPPIHTDQSRCRKPNSERSSHIQKQASLICGIRVIRGKHSGILVSAPWLEQPGKKPLKR